MSEILIKENPEGVAFLCSRPMTIVVLLRKERKNIFKVVSSYWQVRHTAVRWTGFNAFLLYDPDQMSRGHTLSITAALVQLHTPLWFAACKRPLWPVKHTLSADHMTGCLTHEIVVERVCWLLRISPARSSAGAGFLKWVSGLYYLHYLSGKTWFSALPLLSVKYRWISSVCSAKSGKKEKKHSSVNSKHLKAKLDISTYLRETGFN